MGTRADFYVGRGEDAEWLGSIAWDGYPDGPNGVPSFVQSAPTEGEFRNAVRGFFEGRDDVSGPDHGWPWPWDDSNTTDYSYAFDEGCVWVTCFGHGWDRYDQYDHEDERDRPKVSFPDMSRFRQTARAGDNRSGLLSFNIPKEATDGA